MVSSQLSLAVGALAVLVMAALVSTASFAELTQN